MSAILGVIGGKLGMIAVGALIPLVFIGLKKFVPNQITGLIARAFKLEVENIDKIQDPKRKELVQGVALALVKLAEYEIPDKGAGKEKYKLVAIKLCSAIPFLKGQDDKISEIIELAVVAADEELKKQIPK